MENGTYSSSEKSYELELGYDYIDASYKCTRLASYMPQEEAISFVFKINEERLVVITFDKIDGVYGWGYTDADGYYMLGDSLNAETFNKNTILSYYNHNMSSASLRSTIQKLAGSMIDNFCSYMDEDFKDLGITAEDFGFLNY